jgi:hypothetical protein
MTLAPALALAAALAALPYPAPRQLQPTKDTKCDAGSVLLVDGTKGELQLTTAAGVVTFRIGPEVQAFDKDGKPAGAAAAIAPGTRVRVYYLLDDGPRVQEIDVE